MDITLMVGLVLISSGLISILTSGFQVRSLERIYIEDIKLNVIIIGILFIAVGVYIIYDYFRRK